MFGDRLVSIAIFVLLGVIFIAARSGLLPENICNNNLFYNIFREFIHIDTYHFILNAIALYYVSRLEARVGSAKYALLVTAIVIVSALITYLANAMFNFTCAIGFSGVLLGLMAYDLLTRDKTINWKALVYLLLVSINPTAAGGQTVSISGHLIGIISGVLMFGADQAIKYV